MNLLIDIGNSQIKWVVSTVEDVAMPPRWLYQGQLGHEEIESLYLSIRHMPLTKILVSNVAGVQVQQRLNGLLQTLAAKPALEYLVSSVERAGLRNAYRSPAQLGTDRFAAAIAAHRLYPNQNLIIATCGTATTIDSINADGRFEGGMILPGLRLMLESLSQKTAQLPAVDDRTVVQTLFATDTNQAIISGCISAQAGAIERAVQAMSAAVNTPVRCLVAGGAAPAIAPHLAIEHQLVDNLVLIGLHVVAQSHVG